ncbi:unnamed protein product [Brassica napus]|uniref:(rape) hypothetical protein n=1 Tax=Brassica napus TaxID=3708 RepID=A0A816I6T5_BRANA|nr:unnamed protein product [Brassica napus]
MDESNRLRWPIDQSSNKYYSPKQIENQRTNKLILLTLITDFKEFHGPAIPIGGGDKKKEYEDVINERIHVNTKKVNLITQPNLLGLHVVHLLVPPFLACQAFFFFLGWYYFAVAECDSSATANLLYSSYFIHPPRDIATKAPANYQALDFQSQAL